MTDKTKIIADIKRLAIEHPDKQVTRALYRNEGKFSTSDIEKEFGTFAELKRSAGLQLTRPQAQLLNQTARHVSMDQIRSLNVERQDFGDKYRKPTGRRYQTVMVCSDLHDIEMDKFWKRVFVDSVSRVKPDIVCLGGDIFDLPEFGRYSVDPRTWDVVGRIRAIHAFLAELRGASPDTEIVMIEGNHEFRLLRHLAEASPAIKAVLSDLHGMTVSKLLGLDDYEVRYVARGDLGVFTKTDTNNQIARNYEVFFDTLLVDHFPAGINKGLSGYNGHHHKFEARSFYSHLRGPCNWIQLGCGHQRAAEYCEGEQWNMGFAINHIDTERNTVVMNYTPVADFAEVGGKFYFREDSER